MTKKTSVFVLEKLQHRSMKTSRQVSEAGSNQQTRVPSLTLVEQGKTFAFSVYGQLLTASILLVAGSFAVIRSKK